MNNAKKSLINWLENALLAGHWNTHTREPHIHRLTHMPIDRIFWITMPNDLAQWQWFVPYFSLVLPVPRCCWLFHYSAVLRMLVLNHHGELEYVEWGTAAQWQLSLRGLAKGFATWRQHCRRLPNRCWRLSSTNKFGWVQQLELELAKLVNYLIDF